MYFARTAPHSDETEKDKARSARMKNCMEAGLMLSRCHVWYVACGVIGEDMGAHLLAAPPLFASTETGERE